MTNRYQFIVRIIAISFVCVSCGQVERKIRRTTSAITPFGDDASSAKDGSDDSADNVDSNPDLVIDTSNIDLACGLDQVEEPTRVWLLSPRQFELTVAYLTKNDFAFDQQFTPRASTNGFGNSSDVTVSPRNIEEFYSAAQQVSQYMIDNLADFTSCAVDDDTCIPAFLASFGASLFRQPLNQRQTDLYSGIWQDAASTVPAAEALRLTLSAMLQSPYFLYRHELGPEESDGPTVTITAYEWLSALTYSLTNTMPKKEWLTALGDHVGTADQQKVLRQLLDLVLDDADAFDGHVNFFSHLVDLSHLHDRDLSEPIRDNMLLEFDAFITHTLKTNGSLENILTDAIAVTAVPLDTIYDTSSLGEARGDIVQLANRAGILTRPAFLAAHAEDDRPNPISRGLSIRENLLCQNIPDPPEDIVSEIPATNDAGDILTNRERYAAHSEDASCMGCHKMIDPIGFGFEAFDENGMLHEFDHGMAIDTIGELVGINNAESSFDGAIDLSEQLSRSQEVTDCVATQYFRSIMGRREEARDSCSVEAVQRHYREHNGNFESLVREIAKSGLFRARTR